MTKKVSCSICGLSTVEGARNEFYTEVVQPDSWGIKKEGKSYCACCVYNYQRKEEAIEAYKKNLREAWEKEKQDWYKEIKYWSKK